MRPQRVLGDSRGLSSAEYVVILALLAMAMLVSWRVFGGQLEEEVGSAETSIDLMAGEEVAVTPIAAVATADVIDEEAGTVQYRLMAFDEGGGGGGGGGGGTEPPAPPDTIGGIAAQRRLTSEEAREALRNLRDVLAVNWDAFRRAGLIRDQPRNGDFDALAEKLVPVLTNPVYIFRDGSGRTSYFGFIDGVWVQIDFDRNGRLWHAHVLDEYEAAFWLCQAGNPQACAAQQRMDERARREMDVAGSLLSIIVGISPIGVVVDVADIITTCPENPVSFNCGLAVLGIVPGVPPVRRIDELLDIARRVLPSGISRHLPTDVPVPDPERFRVLGTDPKRRESDLRHGVDPDVAGFVPAEARAAVRFDNLPATERHGVTITGRDPSADVDYLGVDASGRPVKVDAFGGSGPDGQFSPPGRISIVNHATKADILIVDWNEIPVARRAEMEAALAEVRRIAAERNPGLKIVEIPRSGSS